MSNYGNFIIIIKLCFRKCPAISCTAFAFSINQQGATQSFWVRSSRSAKDCPLHKYSRNQCHHWRCSYFSINISYFQRSAKKNSHFQVVYVIDSCRAKEKMYSSRNNMVGSFKLKFWKLVLYSIVWLFLGAFRYCLGLKN